jgi:hypothetical protein
MTCALRQAFLLLQKNTLNEIGEVEGPGVTNGCAQESGCSKHQGTSLCSLCQWFHSIVSFEI